MLLLLVVSSQPGLGPPAWLWVPLLLRQMTALKTAPHCDPTVCARSFGIQAGFIFIFSLLLSAQSILVGGKDKLTPFSCKCSVYLTALNPNGSFLCCAMRLEC